MYVVMGKDSRAYNNALTKEKEKNWKREKGLVDRDIKPILLMLDLKGITL